MAAPLPDDEAKRLVALHEHSILDTLPAQEFDDLVRLAAQVCGVPIAAVCLVDEHRQWFKSSIGLTVTETPREAAFCAHTILQRDLLVIPDAQADPLFADNPLVTGEPHIRFYAGVPLITEDGHAVGSLCVIDRVPNRLMPEQEETLRLLARQAAGHLRAARRVAEQEALVTERERLVAERERLVVARERAETERLRLAIIVESCEDAIYSMTLDRMVTSWNRGAENLYGYAAVEIIGRQVDILVPSDRRVETEQILLAVRNGESLAALETVRLTKAGAPLEVALRVSPVLDAGGHVGGASIIARDITERKRTEATLEAEREFTHALLESLREGIVACDAQGTLTVFNRATREMHGLPEQPLPPEQWADHFDLYQADGLTPMSTQDIPLFRAFQGETVHDMEMVIAPRSGPARVLLASGRAIQGTNGEKLGAVVAMHDVTERRQAEREISRLAAIVESLEEAILAATLDGTIVSWNRGAANLYGSSAAEMIGRHVSMLSRHAEASPFPTVVTRLLRGETIEPMEMPLTRWDGIEFDAALSFSPIHSGSGELVGIACITRDITARKRAEAALAETHAALRESSRSLQESRVFIHAVADYSTSMISVFDLDTMSNVYANRGLGEFWGHSPDEIRATGGGLLARVIHPEDLPRMMAHFADFAHVPDGRVLEFETRCLHASGEWRWVCNREVVFKRHLDGSPWQILGNAQDVTQQKALEAGLHERAEQLRQSEAALRAVLESAPVILYAADAEGTVTLSEGTGLAALGLKPGEVVGRSVFEFSSGNPEIEAHTRRALAGEAVTYDARVYGLCLHTELRPLRAPDGSPAGMIGVCFDVTERVASEERFRVLFEHSSDPHLLYDEGGIIDCNDAAAALLRCSDKAQVLSLHPAVLSPELQPDGRLSLEKCVEMDVLARERGFHRFEWVYRKLDGEDFPAEVALTPVTLGDRPVLLAVWHDLTERKRAEEQIRAHAIVLEFQKNELEKANVELESLATTDGLTGMKNHRSFQERLAEEVSRAARYGTPLSVVLLDVDRFKQYNDSHGHPAGDRVLRAVARVLQDSARDTDLAARYGGEEFVLLLPQTDLDGATAFAERLRVSIEEHPWPVRAVTASFGVAGLRLEDENGAALIARADTALYRSKAGGRNRVTCDGANGPVPETPVGGPSPQEQPSPANSGG